MKKSKIKTIAISVVAVLMLGIGSVFANQDIRNAIGDIFFPKGSLEITTEDNLKIEVYLGGEYLGVAPQKWERVSVGTYSLRVEVDGYQPIIQEVVINARENTKVDILYNEFVQGNSYTFFLEPISEPISESISEPISGFISQPISEPISEPSENPGEQIEDFHIGIDSSFNDGVGFDLSDGLPRIVSFVNIDRNVVTYYTGSMMRMIGRIHSTGIDTPVSIEKLENSDVFKTSYDVSFGGGVGVCAQSDGSAYINLVANDGSQYGEWNGGRAIIFSEDSFCNAIAVDSYGDNVAAIVHMGNKQSYEDVLYIYNKKGELVSTNNELSHVYGVEYLPTTYDGNTEGGILVMSVEGNILTLSRLDSQGVMDYDWNGGGSVKIPIGSDDDTIIHIKYIYDEDSQGHIFAVTLYNSAQSDEEVRILVLDSYGETFDKIHLDSYIHVDNKYTVKSLLNGSVDLYNEGGSYELEFDAFDQEGNSILLKMSGNTFERDNSYESSVYSNLVDETNFRIFPNVFEKDEYFMYSETPREYNIRKLIIE